MERDCSFPTSMSSPGTEAKTPLVFRLGFFEWRPFIPLQIGTFSQQGSTTPSDWGCSREMSLLPHRLEASPEQGPLDPVKQIFI